MKQNLHSDSSWRPGFYSLKFDAPLEDEFSRFQLKRLKAKLALVNLIALVFFLIYSVADYLLFPFEIASWTIPIRLFIVAPVIVLCTWISYRTRSSKVFLAAYSSCYMVAGLAVVAIIWIAHSQGVMVPYDGLFLVISYGYFVMSIPFYLANACAWTILILYGIAELHAGFPLNNLYLNLFFLLGANLIGAVGSYVQEHSLRSNFLNQRLLRQRQDQAERENKSKTRFIAAASHDLRQPLNAMNLLLEGLDQSLSESSYQSSDSEHDAGRANSGQLVSRLRSALHQLNDLLGSILDISRLNLGVLTPQCNTMDLDESVRRIVSEFELQTAATRAPELHYESFGRIGVSSDPVWLERIVRNLIANAIRHSGAQRIDVQISVGEGKVWLGVSDDGCGIPRRDQERIFQEFQQVRRHSGRPGSGMGLGLAIVRQLSDLLQIELRLESEAGQGTRFMLGLPAALLGTDEEDKATPADMSFRGSGTESSRGQLDGVSIWLIEDDAENRNALYQFLQSQGACVTLFSGSQELEKYLELDQAAVPELVLTDYRLGDRHTGIAWLLRISKVFGHPVTGICLSADADQVRALATRYPQYTFLTKPVTPARLNLAIRRMISQGAEAATESMDDSPAL